MPLGKPLFTLVHHSATHDKVVPQLNYRQEETVIHKNNKKLVIMNKMGSDAKNNIYVHKEITEIRLQCKIQVSLYKCNAAHRQVLEINVYLV